jgi:hypothetical protein
MISEDEWNRPISTSDEFLLLSSAMGTVLWWCPVIGLGEPPVLKQMATLVDHTNEAFPNRKIPQNE